MHCLQNISTESLISSEILDYLNSYNLITPHQHGFLKKHSTATNLLESINGWSLSLSRRHSVDIAYIDFCRAFDAISHSKFLLKLSAYGFSGNLYLWIKAFLSDRKQLVRINSSCSSICSVLSGVIQGSVLGPLLFNVFIDDVTDTLDNDTTAKLFADDLKLYTNITTSSTHNLQHQLNNIYLWSNAWQLPISFSKCTILHLGKSKNQFQYHFQNIPINESVHPTDLGIIIDPNLRFTDHVQAIVSRARIRSAQIIRCFLSRNILLMTRAFITYVRPILRVRFHHLVPITDNSNNFHWGSSEIIHQTPTRTRKSFVYWAHQNSKTAKLRAPSALTWSRSDVQNNS